MKTKLLSFLCVVLVFCITGCGDPPFRPHFENVWEQPVGMASLKFDNAATIYGINKVACYEQLDADGQVDKAEIRFIDGDGAIVFLVGGSILIAKQTLYEDAGSYHFKILYREGQVNKFCYLYGGQQVRDFYNFLVAKGLVWQ